MNDFNIMKIESNLELPFELINITDSQGYTFEATDDGLWQAVKK